MRLGAYPATLEAGSIVAEAYQSTHVSERHRHRFEVNNEYRDGSPPAVSGSPGHRLTVIWWSSSVPPRHSSVPGRHAGASGTQEPPTQPHPLFVAFRRGRDGLQGGEQLPVEIPDRYSNGMDHLDGSEHLADAIPPGAEHFSEHTARG